MNEMSSKLCGYRSLFRNVLLAKNVGHILTIVTVLNMDE